MGPSAPSRKPNNHPFWGGKLATCPSNKGGGPPVRRCEFGERPKRGGCEGSPKGRSDRSGRPHPAMDRLKNPNPRQAKYPPSNKIPKHPRSAQGATSQTLPIAIKISPDQAPSATQDQIKDTQCPEQRRPRAPKVQTKDTQGPGLDGAFRSVSQAEQPPLLGRQARHLSEQQGWRTTGPALRVGRAPQKGWL